MSFVHNFILLLVVFFALYIFVVSGVAYGFIVDWVRLYFGFVC